MRFSNIKMNSADTIKMFRMNGKRAAETQKIPPAESSAGGTVDISGEPTGNQIATPFSLK